MKTLLLSSLMLVFYTFTVEAQNIAINSTGAAADASAMLDVSSTASGMLIPRVFLTGVNDAATILSPQTSLLVYNTNAALPAGAGFYYNANTPAAPVWTRLGSGNGTVTNIATGTGLTGGPITSTGTISMANMPANTVKGNNTGALAPPTDITIGANSVLGQLGGNITGIPFGTAANTVAWGNHTHTNDHIRLHTMTNTLDHSATAWQVFYSNAAGNVMELGLGAAGTVFTSNGAAAPSWTAANAHTHANLTQGTGITAFTYNGSAAQTVGLAFTGVAAGAYTNTNITVNAQGQITAASSGSAGITGSGVATRVAFWDGPTSLSSNANLYWDNGNSSLGIGGSPTGATYKLHVLSGDAKLGNTATSTMNKLFFGDGSYVYVGENVADDRLYLRGGSLSIDIAGSLGAAGNVLTSDGTTCSWAAGGGGIAGSGTLNYIPLWTPNGTTLGNSRFYQIDANTICLNGTMSFLPASISIYPVSANTKLAIFGSTLFGAALDGTGWAYNTVGGGGIMGVNETSGQYHAGIIGINYPAAPSENTCGVMGINNVQNYFGSLCYYKNALWYAGWFDGEVEITSNISTRNTLNVSGAVASPQAIGKFTNTYAAASDAYGVYGYSRPVDYWGIGGQFEGGYYGVNGVVYPTGSNFYYGTRGYVSGGSGTNYGLYGYAWGTGTNYGVYASAGGGTNWAGYFSGNVALTGALQANGGFGTAGQILTSNGAGAAYWAAAGAGSSLWTDNGTYINANNYPNCQVWDLTSDRQILYIYTNGVYNGTGYSWGTARAATNVCDYDGGNYEFGVGGWNYNDNIRGGGVIGSQYSGTYWGSLGYKNSAGTGYGGCFGAGLHVDFGGGFMSNTIIENIGSGSYGGIMGSWSRGEVLGFTSCGELYAAYNIGNVYTSGHQAEIVTVGDKRVAAYSVTSTDIKIYNDGKAKLINGKTRVIFDASFSGLIGDNTPVVTISPMGQCNGIFIKNVDSKGFDVEELSGGASNVEFSFIVIGKRIDADVNSELPEALADKDFDNKMKGVMFNENNTDRNATPIWWDGTKIRFDMLPVSDVVKKEPEMKDATNIKTSGINTEGNGENTNQNNIIPVKTEKEQFEIQKQKNAEDAGKKMNAESDADYKKYLEEKKNIEKQPKSQNSTAKNANEKE